LIARLSRGAGDGDDSGLQRLAQRIEHPEAELGALIEEQDAAVPQRSAMYLDAPAAAKKIANGHADVL
jgi:hypothetical protein